jgi:hypothetical protein
VQIYYLRDSGLHWVGWRPKHHRKKVRLFATVDLVNALEQEKAMNKAGQLAERLLRLDLVILNEFGYLPFSPSGGALLFHLLSKLWAYPDITLAGARSARDGNMDGILVGRDF